MNVETIVESLLTLLKNSSNITYLLYAVVVSILTQIIKKIFVNKAKTEILGKFNIAVVAPFVLGVLASVVDCVWVSCEWQWDFATIYSVVVQGIAIGAIATVMFRLMSAISGKSMTALLSDEVFAIVYNQLLYFGSVKTQLSEGKLKLTDFLSQVKLVASNIKTIYQDVATDTLNKKAQLSQLLKGIIATDNFSGVIDAIHTAIAGKYSGK